MLMLISKKYTHLRIYITADLVEPPHVFCWTAGQPSPDDLLQFQAHSIISYYYKKLRGLTNQIILTQSITLQKHAERGKGGMTGALDGQIQRREEKKIINQSLARLCPVIPVDCLIWWITAWSVQEASHRSSQILYMHWLLLYSQMFHKRTLTTNQG